MSEPLESERWQRVKDLFLEAVELSDADRPAWLDARCGGDAALRREVESLIDADAPAGAEASFARVVDEAVADAAAAAQVEAAQRIGPYRVLREIGQGGMGTVFLAIRDDDEFRKQVAIKIVRGLPGADVDRRFRAERQILASLEHPSIARLLDGGTTPEGVPYLVMEYVDGEPIDEYCRQASLSIRDRLVLVCRVCDAVTYAHRGFVVHRDLKPSNILVTADGTPKLLDFGIAKLVDVEAAGRPVTRTGLRAMTPEYASPEQIRGERITTASDVYSLGVLLFEVLTGERPLQFKTNQLSEIERVVCEVEPRKPSAVVPSGRTARELAGDLDTIALTALLKEPARRYASAEHLAADIRRSLEGRPVLARPATWRYRSNRFVRRHRAAVTMAAVVLVLMVGSAVALGLQARRVARERDTAERVSNLLLELYSSYDPSRSRGNMVTAQEQLDRGAMRIQSELRDQPEVQARMLDSIGAVYVSVGLFDRAIAVLTESLDVRRSIGGGETLEATRTMNRLALTALDRTEQLPEAEHLARQALDIRRKLAGPHAPETAESLTTLGLVRLHRGYAIDAAPLITESIEIFRAAKGSGSDEAAMGISSLALTWRERADYLRADRFERADLLKAERLEREQLAARRKAFGDAHALTAATMSSLGQLLRAVGRHAEAEPVFREALAVRRQVFGKDAHPSVVESLHDLALSLHDQGRLADAEPLYRSAIASWQQTRSTRRADRAEPDGTAPPQIAIGVNNLGALLEDQRRFGEADAAYREAIAMQRQVLGGDHPGVARMLNNLARVLLVGGRPADALPIADEALAIRRATLGDADFETLTSMVTRGSILGALGRRAEAERLLQDGLAGYRRLLPRGNAHLARAEAAIQKLRSGEVESTSGGLAPPRPQIK